MNHFYIELVKVGAFAFLIISVWVCLLIGLEHLTHWIGKRRARARTR